MYGSTKWKRLIKAMKKIPHLYSVSAPLGFFDNRLPGSPYLDTLESPLRELIIESQPTSNMWIHNCNAKIVGHLVAQADNFKTWENLRLLHIPVYTVNSLNELISLLEKIPSLRELKLIWMKKRGSLNTIDAASTNHICEQLIRLVASKESRLHSIIFCDLSYY